MSRSMSRASILCIVATLTFAMWPITTHAQKAYVPNAGDNTVTVINTATDLPCTTSTCPAAAYPLTVGNVPDDVAISLDGTKAYILDITDNKICKITTATDAVSCMSSAITTVSPYGMMAITPAGTYIYVAGSDPNSHEPAFGVVDTSTMTEVTGAGYPVDVAGANYFTGIAINPASGANQLYAADYNNGQIWVIDTSNDTVTTSITLTSGSAPMGVVFSPDGSKAYVADQSGYVDSINTGSNTVGTHVTGVDNSYGSTQGGIAVSPDGLTVYASTYNAAGTKDEINRIDFSQHPPTQLPIEFADIQGISAMSLNPDGSKLYVMRYDNEVQVVRTADNYQLYLSGAPWPISTGNSPFAYGNFIVAPSSAPLAGSSSVTIVGNANDITPVSGGGICGDLTADWCPTTLDPVIPLTSASSATWPSQDLAAGNATLATHTINSTLYGIAGTHAGPYNQIAVSGGIGYTVQALPCTAGGSLVTSGFPAGFSNPVTYSGSAVFQATNNAFYSSTFSTAPDACWQVGPPTSGSATVMQWNAP